MAGQNPPPDVQARFPDLAGQVAIVTGTSRGIGCGIARVLARQEMKLLLTARSEQAGQAFADELAEQGTEARFVSADVSSAEGAQSVFDAAIEQFGRVDLLVNNAAYTRSKAFLELDAEAFAASCLDNIRMTYHLSYAVAHHQADAGGGSIVHISSVGGLRAHRELAGYDASKGATDALTRSMAVDLAPAGIRVNAIAPGATRRRPTPPRLEPFYAEAGSHIPLGRAGEPEEIGWAVAFLASRAAAYITGQVLYVDGGLTSQLTPPSIWV